VGASIMETYQAYQQCQTAQEGAKGPWDTGDEASYTRPGANTDSACYNFYHSGSALAGASPSRKRTRAERLGSWASTPLLALRGPYSSQAPAPQPHKVDAHTVHAAHTRRLRLRWALGLFTVLWLGAVTVLLGRAQWWQSCMLWVLGRLDATQVAGCARCVSCGLYARVSHPFVHSFMYVWHTCKHAAWVVKLAWAVTSRWSTAKPLQVSLLCRWHVLRGCGTHMQLHPNSYLRTVPDDGVGYITVLGALGRLGMHMAAPPTTANQEQASCAQGSCFDEVSHRSGCNGDLGSAGGPIQFAPADGVAVVDSTHHGEHHVRCLPFVHHSLPLARHS
jgi:hypothetical protein